jgi:two-component sensor histidine kinase
VIILVVGRHRTTTLKLQEVLEKQDARAERLELMFQETEHRVANGLTMVSSLLAMHARSASIDPACAPELFRQAQDRVAMIGQVHRALAAAEPGASQLDLHARSVARSLQELAADRVQIAVDMPPVRIGHEAMQAILMLMGEAIQNSLKHGFPGTATGSIRVELRVGAERTVLTVADNGVGMACGAQDTPDGLGFQIMRGLARGLGGSLDISAGEGLCVTADFPTARLGLEPVGDGARGGERRRTAGPPAPGPAVGHAAGMSGAARGA